MFKEREVQKKPDQLEKKLKKSGEYIKSGLSELKEATTSHPNKNEKNTDQRKTVKIHLAPELNQGKRQYTYILVNLLFWFSYPRERMQAVILSKYFPLEKKKMP